MSDDELRRLFETTAPDMRRHFDVTAERHLRRWKMGRCEDGEPAPPAAPALYVTGQGRISLDIVRVDLATGERTIHHTIRPADPGGIMDLSPAKITPDGKTYAYGYRRYVSDLFVVTGLR